MTDLKTNLRDGAYVALGAAALGVQHLSQKRDMVRSHLDSVSSRFEPVVKDAGEKVAGAMSPLVAYVGPVRTKVEEAATRVIPTANAFAENLAPVAQTFVVQVRTRASQAIDSTRKIADEAKRRVS